MHKLHKRCFTLTVNYSKCEALFMMILSTSIMGNM